ncbi:DUF5133 domain-containing protein [Streptomyces sp. LARHCF249]
MARTPCSAREARQILAAAAELADVAVEDMAAALAAGSRGVPVPPQVARALHRAVEAARTPRSPSPALSVGILPSRHRTEEALRRLRDCQSRLAAAPTDPDALRAMDDVTYTLCVLMGRATAADALLAAEHHLSRPA